MTSSVVSQDSECLLEVTFSTWLMPPCRGFQHASLTRSPEVRSLFELRNPICDVRDLPATRTHPAPRPIVRPQVPITSSHMNQPIAFANVSPAGCGVLVDG